MNTLWLSSLVLAIGAAMMCMVAIAWKSAVLYALPSFSAHIIYH